MNVILITEDRTLYIMEHSDSNGVNQQKTVGLIGVVDDDESVRESISSLLRSAGFRTLMFASAEEFLEFDPGQKADCLLLDMRMPGLSGLELQQRLLELQRP